MRQVSPLELKDYAPLGTENPQRVLRACQWWPFVCGAVLAASLLREAYVYTLGIDTIVGDLSFVALFDVPASAINWVQSLTLAATSATLIFVARRSDSDRHPWTTLSIAFAAMSVDEAVNMHRAVISPLRAQFGNEAFGILISMMPVVVGAVGLGAYLIPMLKRLPRSTVARFVACATVFICGAVVLELASTTIGHRYGLTLAYVVASSAEESFETIGAVAFLYALVRHALSISAYAPTVLVGGFTATSRARPIKSRRAS